MKTQVLDHGHVRLIDTWGSDERIIEAARMSTAKGFQGWDTKHICPIHGDRGPVSNYVDAANPGSACCEAVARVEGDMKLLRFLWENKHHTPFEMGGLTIEVQAPIFVFREWHRHRVPFGYNEMSARYTPLPDVNYIPSMERLMIGSDGKNKQAGTIAGAEPLTTAYAEEFRRRLVDQYRSAEELYQYALARGVPKELARVHLPVGRYSRMMATSNLRGWLGFLKLRMASSAQFEIRQYANEVGELVAKTFPRTWELFHGEHK